MENKIHTELLKALESINELQGKSYDEIKKKFDKIAEILLTKTKIVKGLQEYYITDIEFYLYCKGHEDIITYPRNCEAGMWFFHPSGVDITFKSSGITFSKEKETIKAKIPNNEAFFGGILLRGIELIKDDGEIRKKLDGYPLNVCDELFDKFNAFALPRDFPVLIEYKEHRFYGKKIDNTNKSFRYHMLKKGEEGKKAVFLEDNEIENIKENKSLIEEYSKARAYGILEQNYVKEIDKKSKDDLANKFCQYSMANYRYRIKKENNAW